MRMGMGDGIIIDDDDLLFLFFVFELLSYDLILWTVLSGERLDSVRARESGGGYSTAVVIEAP